MIEVEPGLWIDPELEIKVDIMRKEQFSSFLKDWGVPFAVIADVDTGNAVRVGSSTRWGFDDLDNNLFGDAETVLATARSLEGQILPRMWNQGSVYCVVCKPNEQTVVGLFCSDQLSQVEKYQSAKQLNDLVTQLFLN